LISAAQLLALIGGSQWLDTLTGFDWGAVSRNWQLVSLAFFSVFSVLLFRWWGFWLQESRSPFRYTYSVDDIKPIEGKPTQGCLSCLRHDLTEKLSDRIGRLSLLNVAELTPEASQHIHVSGYYVMRRKELRGQDWWVIDVTPWVRIGPEGQSATMSHPVSF